MSRKLQVFVLSTEGRDSGSPDLGSMPVRFDAIPVTDPFCLRLTSFNSIFTAPNVSYLRGNIIQVDNGTVIVTATLETGSYSIGGSNDIGTAVAKAITAAAAAAGVPYTMTSSYNSSTSKYSFTCTEDFKFVWPLTNRTYIAEQIGFDPTFPQFLSKTQKGTKLPLFYENYFTVTITADNSTTQLVKIPTSAQGAANVTSCSFIIPRTADYGSQIYLTKNEIAAQTLCFSRCPSRLSWSLNRPNGLPLEQTFDWTAVFAVE